MCIRDRNTAASSGMNEDDSETGPDDEETNDQKDSADKEENAPSVSTPSDMEDTTVPGGTVIPAVKSQIFSWSWYDPEENLLDGKLELSGVTEEAQPSFEAVSYTHLEFRYLLSPSRPRYSHTNRDTSAFLWYLSRTAYTCSRVFARVIAT